MLPHEQKGFYITLAAIPVTLALYKLATSDTSTVPFLQRLIEQYSEKQEEWGRRNALHTVAAEQAAQDRHLFLGESTNVKSIELRYPEYVQTRPNDTSLPLLIALVA